MVWIVNQTYSSPRLRDSKATRPCSGVAFWALRYVFQSLHLGEGQQRNNSRKQMSPCRSFELQTRAPGRGVEIREIPKSGCARVQKVFWTHGAKVSLTCTMCNPVLHRCNLVLHRCKRLFAPSVQKTFCTLSSLSRCNAVRPCTLIEWMWMWMAYMAQGSKCKRISASRV